MTSSLLELLVAAKNAFFQAQSSSSSSYAERTKIASFNSLTHPTPPGKFNILVNNHSVFIKLPLMNFVEPTEA